MPRDFGLHSKDFFREEGGQDLVEYSLLLAFIALAAIALLSSAGTSINTIWTGINPIDKRCRVVGTGAHRTVEKPGTASPVQERQCENFQEATGKFEAICLPLLLGAANSKPWPLFEADQRRLPSFLPKGRRPGRAP
jgi:Flp pilus assembly pilin Flp